MKKVKDLNSLLIDGILMMYYPLGFRMKAVFNRYKKFIIKELSNAAEKAEN
jgi:hypothetical protein